MSEASDAWREAAEYAAAVAGVGEQASRDRGVSVARVARMRDFLNVLKRDDPDAFYVCINEHATEAAQAVARLVACRADSEEESAMQKEPTNPNYVMPVEALEE